MIRTPRPLAILAAACLLATLSACGDGGADDTADDGDQQGAPAADGGTIQVVDTELAVDQPIALVPAPEGDDLLVAQRDGLVLQATPDGERLVAGTEPVIDLTGSVGSTEGERGLLGLAVSADGEHLYASYTRAEDGASQVEEFDLALEDGAWHADPESARTLLDVEQPFENHNGGHIEFGPDGMLYVGLGDGGSGGDPEGRAQDPDTLLGKLLRLDPSEEPPIPSDNPFVGDDPIGARDEIWATGLRNPWRFSFDAETGDLWIGDVGQDTTEEIDVLRAADGGGGRGTNLGWDLYEGDQPFADPDPAGGSASTGPFVDPVFTYGREDGCSVTGGVVYRGTSLPGLLGDYLFADLCGEGVRVLRPEGDGFVAEQLTDRPTQVVGFAADRDGEVYVLSLSEGVFVLSAR